jgi:hypothetical protein
LQRIRFPQKRDYLDNLICRLSSPLHLYVVAGNDADQTVFSLFNVVCWGHLEHVQIATGLTALQVPLVPKGTVVTDDYDYTCVLLRVCNRDDQFRYNEFCRYMDDKN